jgi:hypothetical protein
VPGAFEKYVYFINHDNTLNVALTVPDNYFSQEQKKAFKKLYIARCENIQLNKQFSLLFMMADFSDTIDYILAEFY